MGLLCCHTIWKRKRDNGVILLEDIHPYWYYNRPESSVATQLPRPILDPVPIRGRGRPQGALGGVSRVPKSSTKRLPSTFELQGECPSILEAPPSIVLVALPVPTSLILKSIPAPVPSQLSITSLAMARLQARHIDLYEPGTIRERGYMHGISSVFKDDSIENSAEIASRVIEIDEQPIESQMTTIVVDTGYEYKGDTQDAEFELDS